MKHLKLAAAISASVFFSTCTFLGTSSGSAVVPKGAVEVNYGIAPEGIDGPNGVLGLVVANNQGLFLTTDGGTHWSNITPPILAGLEDHIFGIVTVDGHIWVRTGGDDRFDFVPYSSDGGRTWHSFSFPSGSYVADLAFEGVENGWASVTTKGSNRTWSTTDGGQSWSVDKTDGIRAFLGSGNWSPMPTTGVAPSDTQIKKAFRVPGTLRWAEASGPKIGNFFPLYLLRSVNSGKTWTWVIQ